MKNLEQLEIVFDINTLDDLSALQMIINTIYKFDLQKEFELNSGKINCHEFLKKVRQEKRWSHEVRLGGLAFRYGIVSAWNHIFLCIRELESQTVTQWDDWVMPFIEMPGFVQAWVSDSEFDYWQNAADILLYKVAERSCNHLPMISNGLPPPLEQSVIDISKNPGKRVIKNGYVEAIGTRMWLAPSFWARVGCFDPQRLIDAGWRVVHLKNLITLLEVSINVFKENGCMEQQSALRSAIYG